jgi:hypothetical protein
MVVHPRATDVAVLQRSVDRPPHVFLLIVGESFPVSFCLAVLGTSLLG